MDGSFSNRWKRKWADCGFEDIGTTLVSCGNALLPNEAAPFLNFERAGSPVPVWEVFGTPSQWPSDERARLTPYQMIGSDGAGNPICIEHPSEAVVLLDHEDQFRTRQFVNTSVRQLAECLLAYMGERDPSRFRTVVQGIDPAALAEGAFWWHEAVGVG